MASGRGRPIRRSRERVETLALVVRRVPIGEADLLVTLVTRERGLVTAAARSARRASSKLGAIEPMHTLRTAIEITPGQDIVKLAEARIEKVRLALVDDERRLNAAADLLALARRMFAPAAADPDTFDELDGALDALSHAAASDARAVYAWAIARLLAALGYGLDFDRCVKCGTACPAGSAAMVDPTAGGLVCRACGGGPILLSAAQRARIAAWLSEREGELSPADLELVLRIVDQATSARW